MQFNDNRGKILRGSLISVSKLPQVDSKKELSVKFHSNKVVFTEVLSYDDPKAFEKDYIRLSKKYLQRL